MCFMGGKVSLAEDVSLRMASNFCAYPDGAGLDSAAFSDQLQCAATSWRIDTHIYLAIIGFLVLREVEASHDPIAKLDHMIAVGIFSRVLANRQLVELDQRSLPFQIKRAIELDDQRPV